MAMLNIIRAFEEGLARSIQDLIVGLPDHDHIQIYLESNRLRNSHTSANVSIEQWRDPLGASRQVLQNVSNLLNSNENFELDDTLQLDVTHITMPSPGSSLPKGKRKRYCFGTDNYGEFLQSKRSVKPFSVRTIFFIHENFVKRHQTSKTPSNSFGGLQFFVK